MNITRFPKDPRHGDLYEVKSGLLYQYDAGVNGWLEIRSDNFVVELATPIKKGAMSSDDLRKLNRLVLPPPQSTITGTNCPTPFQHGVVQLYSGDSFVGVDGNLDIRNINEFGDIISESRPFHIHQHTYGFDFTLDIPELVRELISRGKLNLQGVIGDKGDKGDTGEDGINNILSGPAGEKGDQGLAPPCDLVIDPEPINAEARPGLKRALVTARLINDSSNTFILEFDRQVVGSSSLSTSSFNVRDSDSFWVLAVTSITGDPQPIYYIDIEPIVDIVRSKFLSEVERLKKGYEDIVEFWIQTMSDLFDEQKAALCCALEYCMSATKSTDQRRHMESVAAAVVGSKGARINLHGRNSNQAVDVSSTKLLSRLPDGKDLCKDITPTPPPPPGPPGPPSQRLDCFVQLDGGFISDNFDSLEDNYPCGECVRIYDGITSRPEKTGSTYTCELSPNNCFEEIIDDYERLFPNIVGRSLNSIAISPGVRFQVFTKVVGEIGQLIFDETGPLVIYNRRYAVDTGPVVPGKITGCDGEQTTYPECIQSSITREWSGSSPRDVEWNDMFPSSTRVISKDLLDNIINKETPQGDLIYGRGRIVKILCDINTTQKSQATKLSAHKTVVVDPIINIATIKTAASIELPRGEYTAIIDQTDVRIAGKYGMPLKIQYIDKGAKKTIQFLDKGRFDTLTDAKSAYQGLSLSLDHDGGMVYLYYPIVPTSDVSGNSIVKIEPIVSLEKQIVNIGKQDVVSNLSKTFSCFMSSQHLRWYRDSWDRGECCGVVVNISGQDYIIFKKGIGEDEACGGGESHNTPCMSAAFETFGQYPAFAWPTFDGTSFLEVSEENVKFMYDESINDMVLHKINNGDYDNPKGRSSGHRHLVHQLSLILFPAN